MLRQVLGRAARVFGSRAESTMAAATAGGMQKLAVPTDDPIMRPYYEALRNMKVVPATSPMESSASERAGELALLRLHNMSLPIEGHMIKAQIIEVARRTVVLDTGLKYCKVSRSEIPADCIIGSTVQSDVPRRPGELREGDVVQVFLESSMTPEGGMLVSGVQAAVQRRLAAVWMELEERKEQGQLVKGRILNSVSKGYSVGVAGIIGFLPARQCARPTARRIGQLQKFRILDVDRSRQSVVLSDPNLHYADSAAQRDGGHFATRRPARNEEEVLRRQELVKVADELRSVLAMRNHSSSVSSRSGGQNARGSSTAAAPAAAHHNKR